MKYVFTDQEIIHAVGCYLADRVIRAPVSMNGKIYRAEDGRVVVEMEPLPYDKDAPNTPLPFVSPVDG